MRVLLASILMFFAASCADAEENRISDYTDKPALICIDGIGIYDSVSDEYKRSFFSYTINIISPDKIWYIIEMPTEKELIGGSEVKRSISVETKDIGKIRGHSYKSNGIPEVVFKEEGLYKIFLSEAPPIDVEDMDEFSRCELYWESR